MGFRSHDEKEDGKMRCSCRECGEYMVHEEKNLGGCICPVCGNRCRDCLGTSTLISKEEFSRLKNDPFFEMEIIDRANETEDDIC